MLIEKKMIEDSNDQLLKVHKRRFEFTSAEVPHIKNIIEKLKAFQVAIPSWALGTGGTRFGRFPGGGDPRNLEEKMEDIALLHALNRSSGAISLHIPWDIPTDSSKIKSLAAKYGLAFDAMNSNTFQDQPGQALSYKLDSMNLVIKLFVNRVFIINLKVS